MKSLFLNLVSAISGKKSYALAVAGIIYAFVGAYLGKFSSKEALDMIWVSLSVATLRAGIAKL